MQRSAFVRSAFVLVALMVFGACGDDDGDDTAASDTSVEDGGEEYVAPGEGEGEGEAPASGDAVSISGFAFDPAALEVEAGTEVTWTNADSTTHTVTAGTLAEPSDEFNERLEGADTTASITFDETGEFPYICTIHAGMEGTIVVR